MVYTRKEVVEVTKLTPRQVQYYTEKGLTDVTLDKGRGSTRLYIKQDVLTLMIVKELWNFGMSISAIKKVLLIVDRTDSDYVYIKGDSFGENHNKYFARFHINLAAIRELLAKRTRAILMR